MRLLGKPREGLETSAPPPMALAPASDPQPQPDHAWKALGLVIDWIKHAEAKAGALLAATGVAGGVLYNLVKDQDRPSIALMIAAGLCGVFLFVAGVCAGFAFRPRLRAGEEPTSALYYHHIARRHARGKGSDEYSQLVAEITGNAEQLVNEVASQIWANAHVASEKYAWINRTMAAFLAALPCLAAVAVIITFHWN